MHNMYALCTSICKCCICAITDQLFNSTHDVQVDSDYVDQLEHFVPLVCTNCEAHPLGLYDPAPEHVRVLNIVCMQALRQHLALAHRVSFTSHHLEAMMKVTLNTLAQPVSDAEAAEDRDTDVDSLHPLDPQFMRSSGQQPQTDAAAGSAGDGPAVGSADRASSVGGPTAHITTNTRPSALHRISGASTDGKLQHKHGSEDRHVQIVEASSRNGTLDPALSQAHDGSMEHHMSHHNGVDLRSSLATWVENARSKLGIQAEDGMEKPPDKTTDNRGGSESTSEAINMQRDSITSNPAQHQNSLTLSNASVPHQVSAHWRGSEGARASLERRDSITSSVYITIESPNNVARHLLEDLARMTKAGICLLCLHGSAHVCGQFLWFWQWAYTTLQSLHGQNIG